PPAPSPPPLHDALPISTAFVAPGQFAASPAPRRKRNAQKLLSPPASDVSIAASEYQSTPSVSPVRVPTRSRNRPITGWPIVYATDRKSTRLNSSHVSTS